MRALIHDLVALALLLLPALGQNALLESLSAPALAIDAIDDTLAVWTEDAINVYRLNASSSDYSADLFATTRFETLAGTTQMTFRFTGPDRILACQNFSCSIFQIDSESNDLRLKNNVKIDKFDPESLASVEVAAGIEELAVVFISNGHFRNSTIQLYNITTESLVGEANDFPYHQNEPHSFGFFHKGYLFFVGTATRLDNPRSLVEKSSRTHNITNIRVTRICGRDRTLNLETRIDISLQCKLPTDVDFVASAASVSPDRRMLYVAAKHPHKQLTVVCEFEVDDMMAYFETSWNTCQNMTNPDQIQKKCINKDIEDPTQCHLFSWLAKKRYPICQRFNGNQVTEPLHNCDLASSTLQAYRFGWIENYKPFVGKEIARIDSDKVVSVTASFDDGAIYALLADNSLRRILSNGNTSTLLWKSGAERIATGLTTSFEPSKKNIVYIAQDKDIAFIQSRCESLYSDCQSISWSDPLRCGFCAFSNSSGYVAPHHRQFDCQQSGGQFCANFCPPTIKATNFGVDTVNIVGQNLREFESDLQVFVCGEKCLTSHWSNELITCKVRTHLHVDCSLTISGRLNRSAAEFQLRQSQLVSPAKDENRKGTNMKWLRFVAAAGAIVVVMALLCCVTCFTKFYQRKRQHQLLAKRTHFFPAKNGEHLSLGNSATVHLGIMKRSGKQIQVAVKRIKYYDMAELNKAMREVQLISVCKHPNIVECIGYSKDKNGYLNVLMEYVQGGDLHSYLIDKDKSLVARTAFSYIEQLVKGMQYMATQKIIHRDLAARNCLLNEDYTKLKITDFGLCRRANYDDEYVAQDQTVKLPFRWTAVECLTGEYAFSEKSDVWSFGVVCWEVFSRERMPYKDLHSSEDVFRYLTSGSRLGHPAASCPLELYSQVMMACWDVNPHRRPTFDELAVNIQKLLKALDEIYERPLNQLENDGYEKPLSVANRSGHTSVDFDSSCTDFRRPDSGYAGLHTSVVSGPLRNIYTEKPVSDFQPATPNGYEGPHAHSTPMS